MSMVREFREFAVKANAMDLAVGVIIGAAFGKIIDSLVKDLIMPIVGLFLGGVNFAELSIEVGDAVLKYGSFIQALVDFLIIALVIFLLVRTLNKLRRERPVPPSAPPEDIILLRDIREALTRR